MIWQRFLSVWLWKESLRNSARDAHPTECVWDDPQQVIHGFFYSEPEQLLLFRALMRQQGDWSVARKISERNWPLWEDCAVLGTAQHAAHSHVSSLFFTVTVPFARRLEMISCGAWRGKSQNWLYLDGTWLIQGTLMSASDSTGTWPFNRLSAGTRNTADGSFLSQYLKWIHTSVWRFHLIAPRLEDEKSTMV